MPCTKGVRNGAHLGTGILSQDYQKNLEKLFMT
jgi:hypothetical protein